MKPVALFDLLDAGFDLPEEVVRFGEAARALAGLTVPPMESRPPDARAVHAQVVSDTVVAAEKGKPALPDAERLRKADADRKEWEARELTRRTQGELLKAAQAEALQNAREVLGEHNVPIIKGLAAELDALMVELRTLAPLVKGFSQGTVVRASDEVRAAWIRIDEIAVRHDAIRSAQVGITNIVGVQVDTDSQFSLFRNLPSVWTAYARQRDSSPPWPTDSTRKFLLWLCDHPELEVWCPTPAERDERHREHYGDRVAGRMSRQHDPVAHAS